MKAIIQSQILQKTTKILAGQNVAVYTEGFAPRVEYDVKTKQPKAVYIPEVPELASDKLVNAIQGYIDHECGHVLESSSDDICDTSKSQLWHYIHNCIEDPRINAKMSERFAGSETNIRNGYEFLFERVDPKTKINAYDKKCVDKIDLTDEEKVKDEQANYSCMWFAKKANCRFTAAKYDELALDRLFAPLEAKMDKSYVDKLTCDTTDDVKEATDYFVDFFHRELSEKPSSGKDEGKGKPLKGDVPPGSRLDKLKKIEDKLGEVIASEIESLVKSAHKGIYWTDRFNFTISKHEMAKGETTSSIAAFEDKTKLVTNYLAKDLRRILESRQRQWYTGGHRSGRLNQKALHSVRLGNDRVFSKKSEIKHVRAAVSLLIDLSGSMNGEKVEIAAQSAYAFAMVLDQLKVPYEIFGFTTIYSIDKIKVWSEAKFGPEITRLVINPTLADNLYAFKTFDEHFDVTCKVALIACADSQIGMKENEDAIHVKLALERLAVRPEEKKTLFVFSDGMPSFPGDTMKSQMMLRYLDQVSKSQYGVDIFGIGIQSPSIKNYYNNSQVVNDLSQLPATLFEFLKTRI